jgi:hypothetical protein
MLRLDDLMHMPSKGHAAHLQLDMECTPALMAMCALCNLVLATMLSLLIVQMQMLLQMQSQLQDCGAVE